MKTVSLVRKMAEENKFGIRYMSSNWKAEVWLEDRAVIGSNQDTLGDAIKCAKIYREQYSHPSHSVFVIGRDGTIMDERAIQQYVLCP